MPTPQETELNGPPQPQGNKYKECPQFETAGIIYEVYFIPFLRICRRVICEILHSISKSAI